MSPRGIFNKTHPSLSGSLRAQAPTSRSRSLPEPPPHLTFSSLFCFCVLSACTCSSEVTVTSIATLSFVLHRDMLIQTIVLSRFPLRSPPGTVTAFGLITLLVMLNTWSHGSHTTMQSSSMTRLPPDGASVAAAAASSVASSDE